MRKFHSYGPVDREEHFCVGREELVHRCREQLVGNPEKSGHYFTIWAPRQTGKTWLMRQVEMELEIRCKERFSIHSLSFGNLRGMRHEPPGAVDIPAPFSDVLEAGLPGNPLVKTWKYFSYLFSRDKGLWRKPLILMIDEVDMAPPDLLDLIVGRFREMYLNRRGYPLHGLALIGVRAVLGVESDRGSPFNVQKSLHVPNFTMEEVTELFRQYESESGQTIAPGVARQVFEATGGQPGQVGWFGELLTETYNPGAPDPIDLSTIRDAYEAACFREWNNTVLNWVKKARGPYVQYVMDLFEKSDMPFSIYAEWCNYLYLNGVIQEKAETDRTGRTRYVCRFSSPFVQTCLFHALTLDLVGDRFPILPLAPLDTLADVFDNPELDLVALLERYAAYLKRLKAKDIDPWREMPRRSDLRLIEVVGHFHLYAWLKTVLEDVCVVSPEFPTGNGRVDLHLRCADKSGIIEVKSFQTEKAHDGRRILV